MIWLVVVVVVALSGMTYGSTLVVIVMMQTSRHGLQKMEEHLPTAPNNNDNNNNNSVHDDNDIDVRRSNVSLLNGMSLVDCTLSIPPHPTTTNNSTSSSSTTTTTTTTTMTRAMTGILHITVRHDLSPLASAVFLKLVQSKYYDGVFVFRVLPQFVAQWGARHVGLPPPLPLQHGHDDVLSSWKQDDKTTDTMMTHKRSLLLLSNVRGTLSFAGGNPNTKQVYVNLGNNSRLDKEQSLQGRPFATLNDKAMTMLLDQLYTGYQDGNGQIQTMKRPNAEMAMKQQFPYMAQIQQCHVIFG